MMTDATHPEICVDVSAPALSDRSQKREQRGHPIEMPRMMGLQTAYEILGGKKALAEVMGVCLRGLNYKLNADRGISDLDLLLTAKSLETRGNKMLEHAAKLRAVLFANDHVAA